MAKSSINFQVAKKNSTAHLLRKSKVNYLLIHDKNVNEYLDLSDANNHLQKAIITTKEKTGRKMQKLAIDNFIQEAVLNLHEHHTIDDVQNVFDKLNKKYGGFKVFKIAIHRDEGVFIDTQYDIKNLIHDSKKLKWYDAYGNDVDDDVNSYAPNRDIFYNKVDKSWYQDRKFTKKADTDKLQMFMNYHAHIQFTKYDERIGKNVRLQIQDLQDIQTLVAKELGMERGEKNSQTKRMTHWQLKKQYEKENKQKIEALAKQKDLKVEVAKLRAELKNDGATRTEYAKLEELTKKLKIEVKEKTLTINSLENQLLNARESLLNKNTTIDTLKEEKALIEQNMKETTSLKNEFENTLINIADIVRYTGDSIDELEDKVKELSSNNQSLNNSTKRQLTNILLTSKDEQNNVMHLNDDEIVQRAEQLKQQNIWFKQKFLELNQLLKNPKKTFEDIFKALKEKLSTGYENVYKKIKSNATKTNQLFTNKGSKNHISKTQKKRY